MSQEFKFRRVKTEKDEDGKTYCKVHWPWEDVNPPVRMEVLILPEVSDRKGRSHMLIEGISNLFCEVTGGLSNNFNSDNHKLTDQGFNKELVCAYKELGDLLQYMVNCKSFTTDTVQQFDYEEFCSRLNSIKYYLGSATR